MAKEYSKQSMKLYRSKAYLKSRQSYIDKRILIDGGMCEHCRINKGQELDHIIELNSSNLNDVNITLSHDNFQWLCHNCHTRKTHSKGKSRVTFDMLGNPIIND